MKALLLATIVLASFSVFAGSKNEMEQRIEKLESRFKPGSMEDILKAVRSAHGIITLDQKALTLNGVRIPTEYRGDATVVNSADTICKFLNFDRAEVFTAAYADNCEIKSVIKLVELADGRIQAGTVTTGQTGCAAKQNEYYTSIICVK